jgi:hypothetical protein
VANVGTVFVVKRRVKLARSALEEEEGCEANWLLTVRTGDAYVGKGPSSRGDLSPLGKAIMVYTISNTLTISMSYVWRKCRGEWAQGKQCG